MADTRKITYGSPFATPEQRSKRLQGFLGGFYEGITELPLDIAEAVAPGSGYTPGELRSSPKDRIRAEQFEIQEFMDQMEQDPDFARGSQLGYGTSFVFDPVIDTGIAAAPMTYRGLKGLARLVESGELAEGAATLGRRLATDQRGSFSLKSKIQHGKPIDFPFIRNTEKAPDMGSRFGQDIEPAGRYMQEKPSTWRGDKAEQEVNPNMVSGSVRFEKPYVIDFGDTSYQDPSNWKRVLSERYGGKTGKELSKALMKEGYDAVITIGKQGEVSEVVDLTPLKPGEEPRLIAQHNIRPQGVLHAEKMGGLPAPSLAVTKETTPLEGFGEITLLGSKEMVDPKAAGSAKTFGADIYSPRYPQVEYLPNRSRLEEIESSLMRNAEKVGEKRGFDIDQFEREGGKAVENNPLVMADFLEKQGMEIPTQRWPEGEVDEWKTKNEMRKLIEEDPTLQGKYLDHVAAITDDIKDSERLFLGFTYSGRRRYAPHTLDNVVKQMRKDLRGGEGFNYGVGSIRAKYTPQFRSLKQIRENKGRLVSKEDFQTVKNEIDAEFSELFDHYYDHMENKPSGFGAMDVFSAHLEEAATTGVDRMLREYYDDAADPEPLRKFLQKVKNLPTEYFEAKFTRPVDVGEFKVAVVPEGTNPRVIESLKRMGIEEIETYKKGDYESRKKSIGKFGDLMFSAAPFGVLIGSPEKRKNLQQDERPLTDEEFNEMQGRLDALLQGA